MKKAQMKKAKVKKPVRPNGPRIDHQRSRAFRCTLAFATTLLFVGHLSVAAKDLTRAEPEDVGLSAQRLERIDARVQQHLAQAGLVGAVGLVARHNRIAYSGAWGYRDRELGTPMTSDTIFRLYSMTKPITSVAFMTLYEEGHFFLSDPIAKFLPEFAQPTVLVEATEGGLETRPVARGITIRDLLRHTAGFGGFGGETEVELLYQETGVLQASEDLAEFSRALARLPLLYEPGSRWHYSLATDLLARLAEVISGQPFDQFLRDRVLTPLAMKDTGFQIPASEIERFAQLYSPSPSAGPRPAPPDPVPADPRRSRHYIEGTTLFSGGSGLVSTAQDYLRFAQMLLNGGQLDGVRILSRKSVELMTTNQLEDVPSYKELEPGYGFGLGVAVVTDPGYIGEVGSRGEYNWGGSAGTTFWIDPQEELVGVFMTQLLPHRSRMAAVFHQLVTQAISD